MYWRQRGPFPAGGKTENGLRRRNLHHQGIVGAFARSSRDNLPSPAAGTSAGLSGRRRLALQSRRDRAMGTTTGSRTPATSRSRAASAQRVARTGSTGLPFTLKADAPGTDFGIHRAPLLSLKPFVLLGSLALFPSAFLFCLADEVFDLGGDAIALGSAHAHRVFRDLL